MQFTPFSYNYRSKDLDLDYFNYSLLTKKLMVHVTWIYRSCKTYTVNSVHIDLKVNLQKMA